MSWKDFWPLGQTNEHMLWPFAVATFFGVYNTLRNGRVHRAYWINRERWPKLYWALVLAFTLLGICLFDFRVVWFFIRS